MRNRDEERGGKHEGKGRKKGIQLFATIVSMIFLIAISFVMVGVILYTKEAQNLCSGFFGIKGGGECKGTIELVLKGDHLPLFQQSALLAYLESDGSGALSKVKMKELLEAAAIQENTDDFWIVKNESDTYGTQTYEVVEVKNLKEQSDIIFDKLGYDSYILLLSSSDGQHLISKGGSISDALNQRLSLKRLAQPLFLPNGVAEIVLYTTME